MNRVRIAESELQTLVSTEAQDTVALGEVEGVNGSLQISEEGGDKGGQKKGASREVDAGSVHQEWWAVE